MAHTQTTPALASAQDPISRDSTQIFTPDRPVRRYTVGYGPRSIRGQDGHSALVPMLRLQGAWLKRAGFAVGTPVTVRVDAGRLVIEVAEPERVADVDELVRRLKRRRAD